MGQRTPTVEMDDPISQEIHRRGDFELNRIYCGDCLEVMQTMPDEFVDLIITSPPYNFGLDDYEGHDDTRSWETYFQWLNEVFVECHRVLKHSGRICVNVQPLFSDYIPTHHIVSQQLRDLGLLFKAEILWEKHNYNCKYTAWGSWKSPSMPYLKYTWEFVEVFCKDMEHFVSFLNQKLHQVAGVQRTQTFMILKMYKLSYRWGEAEPPRAGHRTPIYLEG